MLTERPERSSAPFLILGTLLALAGASGCNAPDADARDATEGDSPSVRASGGRAAGTQGAGALDPAAIDLGHTMGNPDAPIAVVEFSDFGCPYCARFARETMPRIQQEFIDEGLVRWRYVPVTFGFAGGERMAAAAECAARQGGPEVFWRVHDLFYDRQVALRGDDARPRLLEWLTGLGLDRPDLEECMDAPETGALLDRHNQAARGWYVRGTPTFIINGVPMSGALPLEFFRRVFATMLDPSGL